MLKLIILLENVFLAKKNVRIFIYLKNHFFGSCTECRDEYFKFDDNICTKSQNFIKRNKNSECIKCSEGYFLSKSGNICITREHCILTNYDFWFCEICENSFYLEVETRKCFSNKENEKFKFCSKVSLGNCINCESGYVFAKDNKCVSSLNCTEAENGICIKCDEGYYLGLDNNCVNIKICIYSNDGECLECENDYYFDSSEKKCLTAINQYKNCKRSNLYEEYCEQCKNDFYLSVSDKKCYSNTENGLLYKCAVFDGIKCSECVDDYFFGEKDLKCSKIEECANSENENKCAECDQNYCLDKNKKIYVDNTCGQKVMSK